MYKRMIIRLFLTISLVTFFIACAKISSPSGGRRDKTPPAVVKSNPLPATKNFKGNKIEIEFNEYVILDNINEKFMVSPPMKKKPRVFTKGKSVMVQWEEKLKDSTTYTLYFLDGIKDLNEGNILQNYEFVFSTGPVIDSLSVTGNIYNADNLDVPEKTQVLMYRELADSAVEKHLPDYITRLDLTGYFRINNIRPGTYRLYGLKEDDNSKTYNLPDEQFAFLDSAILITSEKNFMPPPVIVKDTVKTKKMVNQKTTVKDTTTVKKGAEKIITPALLTGEYSLYQFQAKKKNHYLMNSQRDQKFHLSFILSLPPDPMSFRFTIPGEDSSKYFIEQNIARDTINVWIIDSTLYSKNEIKTLIRYPFTDSTKAIIYKLDSLSMRFATPRPPRNAAKAKKAKYTIENNIQTGFLKPGETIVLKSKLPVYTADTSRIRLYEILKDVKKRISYNLIRDSLSTSKYFLKAKLAQQKNYLFISDSAAFRNIYNEYSDSTGIKFSIKDPSTYCKLSFNIKNYKGPRIIQLLDKSERLIAEKYMPADGKVVFSLIESGTYRARVIYDLNGDKKWTTGDFAVDRQPEPVSYWPAQIELKVGWELVDQEWDIGIQNYKEQKLRTMPKK